MKPDKHDLIKASSLAIGLIIIIAILGMYVFPNYIFVNPNHQIYLTGLVDHKSISETYVNGGLVEGFTISVKIFEDDPINSVNDGETAAYTVSYDDWLIIEWGDTVNLKLKSDFRAELSDVFPALKLPEWHAISGSASPLNIEISTDKTIYTLNEKAMFSVTIKNNPNVKGWIDSTIPISLSLLESSRLYVFKDGKNVYNTSSDLWANEIVLDPYSETIHILEWDLKNLDGSKVTEGVYYVRIYLGHFTGNKQITLACTTMIMIGNE